MKRHRLLVVLSAILSFVIGLSAFNGCTKMLTVESIEVKTNPSKTAYAIGDTLDLTGGELTVTYDNKAIETLSMADKDITYNGFDSSVVGDKAVTVSYKEKTTEFVVSVLPNMDSRGIVSSIVIKKLPTKTVYGLGEALNLSGGEFLITYDDLSEHILSMTEEGVTHNGFDSSSLGTKTVNLIYKTKTVALTVAVAYSYLANNLEANASAYYTRFTESWRAVNSQGWAINKMLENPANADKLNRALKLFDYMYSKDGNTLMSYGPPEWLDGTTSYNGKQVPRLSDYALSEIKKLESDSLYTSYFRNWLGSCLPIGYIKEQGLEYQLTHPNAREGIDNINTAVSLKTLDHLRVSKSTFEYRNLATPLLPDPSNPVNLSMAVMYQGPSKIIFNSSMNTGMSGGNGADFYNASKTNGDGTWTGADGNIYTLNSLKPVWRNLGERLKINFYDVTGSQSNISSLYANIMNDYSANSTSFDVITGYASDIIKDGSRGKFVNLLDHLDKMPNFKSFLDSSPLIKAAGLSIDGALYYTPFLDGFDDIENSFMMRTDWVEKLLDGSKEPAFDTEKTLSAIAYKPFNSESFNNNITVVKSDKSGTETLTKNYTSNIVTLQNGCEVKNGAQLTRALRDYIDTAYNGYYGNKRSDLFIGVNAAYDADELIALLRCVKTNPALLTGSASTDIVPFYMRNNTANYLMNLYRFMSIWGVRGLDSRINFMFADENGKLKDSRFEPKTMAALESMNFLYKEGLILSDFPDAAAVTGVTYNNENSFRARVNAQNRGFMTYDLVNSTAEMNGLGDGANPLISDFCLVPVLPPFTDWGFTAAPQDSDPRFRSLPSRLNFSEDSQIQLNSYTALNGSASYFNIISANGDNRSPYYGISSVVWSDAIIQGFGANFTKNNVTYSFSSKSAFLEQVRVSWGGQSFLEIYNRTYR